MNTLPNTVTAYKKIGPFTKDSVPKGLLKEHCTACNTWGLLQVEQGELDYYIGEELNVLSPGNNGVIEPQAIHHINPQEGVSFTLEFYK